MEFSHQKWWIFPVRYVTRGYLPLLCWWLQQPNLSSSPCLADCPKFSPGWSCFPVHPCPPAWPTGGGLMLGTTHERWGKLGVLYCCFTHMFGIYCYVVLLIFCVPLARLRGFSSPMVIFFQKESWKCWKILFTANNSLSCHSQQPSLIGFWLGF